MMLLPSCLWLAAFWSLDLIFSVCEVKNTSLHTPFFHVLEKQQFVPHIHGWPRVDLAYVSIFTRNPSLAGGLAGDFTGNQY